MADLSRFVPERLRHLLGAPTTSVEGAPKAIPLGDRIARIAEPIAATADALLGTKLADCGACKSAQDALNRGGHRSDEPGRPIV